MDGPPTNPSAPRSPERAGLSSAAGPPPRDAAQEDLERLRALLVTPETKRLDAIQERIEDPETRCNEVAEVLAEAVRRAGATPALAASLSPLVEQGLAQSIRRDPSVIIEVIFPVLGPAIRRAVASALRGAVESLNRVVEHSFTWRGLRWRMEAWRTGRPVAEVALSRSVVYRVEQVFLIHRETGLPLMVVGADEERRDPDLVSSMLTAIQDFVHDSFSVSGDQDLDRLEVGDFQVWIERGPRAAVAAVIRGSARRRLRTQLAETIGDIHGQLREALERFDGDSAPFEPARPLLESCLEQEFVRPRKRKGRLQPSAIVAIALVALLTAGWFWWRWRDQQRWDAYLAALDAEPGLVAFDQGAGGGYRRALVLRDPLAVDPATLLAGAEVDPADVVLRVESVVSTDPSIVARRARKLLGAPDSVELAVRDNELVATGSAPAAWIREAEAKAAFVPGVEAVRLEALGDADRMELEAVAERLARLRVLFDPGSVRLDASQQETIDAMAAGLLDAARRTEAMGVPLRARLLGGADSTGAEQTNARLRRQRADIVRRRLLAGGAPADGLAALPADRDLGNSAEERRSVAVEIELP